MTLGIATDHSTRVRNLTVVVARTGEKILNAVDLDLRAGRLLGVVGESGSGKTTLGLALLGHVRPGLAFTAGELKVGDVEIGSLGSKELRSVRGRTVAYIPQDAASALNPNRRIGDQMREMLTSNGWKEDVAQRVDELIREVNLPEDATFLRRFPFELSGGQQQRVGIAMAFACRPDVVVLDEPTTGLDVLTQARVLETIKRMITIHGCSGLYISHDLSVVSSIVDDVAVMYAGTIVESGPVADIFERPRHPYTARLIESVPMFHSAGDLRGIPGSAPSVGDIESGCRFAPRCLKATDECLKDEPPASSELGHAWRCFHPLTHPGVAEGADLAGPLRRVTDLAAPAPVLIRISNLTAGYVGKQVLHDMNLDIPQGRCLGLLGESGSGKTTLARVLAGVAIRGEGDIEFDGSTLPRGARKRTVEQRRRIGYVFQNPYNSLNPRRTIGDSVALPLKAQGVRPGPQLRERVARALELAALPVSVTHRYPGELSGGQRQRAAIARGLVTDPDFLICDEVTSALDVSVQASIVRLLNDLQADMGLTLLFVTHDIALLRYVAQDIAVLQNGRIVERGLAPDLLSSPQHAYTQDLVGNAKKLASIGAAV